MLTIDSANAEWGSGGRHTASPASPATGVREGVAFGGGDTAAGSGVVKAGRASEAVRASSGFSTVAASVISSADKAWTHAWDSKVNGKGRPL